MEKSVALKDLGLMLDGIPIVQLGFGISLYTDHTLSSFSSDLIKTFDKFRNIVGDENLCWYSTDTMTHHKSVNPRIFRMLEDWFIKNKPKDTYGFEITNAEPFNAAPTIRFEVSGTEVISNGERLESATLIRWVLPPEWGFNRYNDALKLVQELCEFIPFRSGQAGFVFDCSRYFEREAFEYAWTKSMQFPGIDINSLSGLDCNAVCYDGVRGVGWLTILDNRFIKQLEKLPKFKECEVINIKNGIIIKAGDKPIIGDINDKNSIAAYQETFKYIQPLTIETFERSPWLPLNNLKTSAERTKQWYERLAQK